MSARLFSESAAIDIATSFAFFDKIDFSADFKDFVDGDFRIRHFLTLIHEGAHHWCLSTPVGTALAARTYAAYHDAIYVAVELQCGLPQTAQRVDSLNASLLASRMLTAFIVPLLEGLALYAEWRAVPGTGGVYSRPFDLYLLLCGRFRSDSEDNEVSKQLAMLAQGRSMEEIDKILLTWMRSDEGQKADSTAIYRTVLELRFLRTRVEERSRLRRVFSSPVDPRHGSYQLGYLFVCALEQLCDAHGRTDILLAYLRHYFFNDSELAALILDQDLSFPDLYAQVRQHLQSKVNTLLRHPKASAERLKRWAEEMHDAPVTRSTLDDFFGRRPTAKTGSSSATGEDAVYDRFKKRLSELCEAVGSDIIGATDLWNFLLSGRMLMPLGSKEFWVVEDQRDQLRLEGEDGLVIDIAKEPMAKVPAVGTRITLAMLVNVSSPGTMITVKWRDGFEVVPVFPSHGVDTISKEMVEHTYKRSEIIGSVVEEGRRIIGRLARPLTGGGVEPVEAAIEELLRDEAVALDITQIYRGAIVIAFSKQIPMPPTPQWRKEAFEAWEPYGVLSLLAEPDLFDMFLKTCGMPPALRIDADRLRRLGLVEATDEEIRAMTEKFFETVNHIPEADYRDAVSTVKSRFEQHGLTLFGETRGGEFVSLI